MLRLIALIILLIPDSYEEGEDSNVNESVPVRFYLFNSKQSNGVVISTINSSEYLNEIFLIDRDVKVAAHGWLGSDKSSIVQDITTVYVKERDVNGIRMDWSLLAGSVVYPVSALQVEQAATALALLLDHLVKSGVTSPDNLHLIGHSLGAHVVGTAGSKMTTGRPARVTGLDPARPGFEILGEFSPGILDKSDGRFVDVIHSAGGAAGYIYPIGHADFYPNGGNAPQPGCFQLLDPMNIVGCSHARSYEYYIESISLKGKQFKSVECKNWNSFSNGNCKSNQPVLMGDPVSNKSNGVFYLITNAEPPYARG